ncbi:uncharacterized protein MKZ38_000765 [Zalerion maritima]|uniref:MARVEL domain-containing protein n=1 Tax=Zalerion maritima TaxID=339359 RepID=A0AAD5RS84_9PEZI|nr:uncharacterized protein MKZ38_000765 [Zalerion maritima]
MAEPTSPPVNFMDRFSADGKDRSHLPPLSPLVAGLRAAQLVLNLLILILAAVSADRFGTSDVDVYGMTFFTFAWTLFFFGYVYGTAIFVPEFYNVYAHLGAEFLTCLWWLVSWALCASRANDFNFYRGSSSRANLFLDTLAAAAGLGALQWLLFIGTLVLLAMYVMNTKYPNGFPKPQVKPTGGGGPGPGPAPVEAPPVGPNGNYGQQPVEMDHMSQAPPAAQPHMGPGRMSPYPEETGIPTGPPHNPQANNQV